MKHILSILLTIILLCLININLKAQGEEEKLKISGSVDTYYKYDFSGVGNIPTSFADEQNSLSIGMIDLALEKEVGAASFVAELAFGPRNAASAGPAPTDAEGVASFLPHIQNLYLSYGLTDKLSVTAGYMGTFVGYEIISPSGNANYSTSYLFTNGPFQNAGVKLDYAVSDKVGLMVGLFNPWNVYVSESGLNNLGAQLYLSPVDGWDVYLNFVTEFGEEFSPTELDLTTTFELSDKLSLGLNAATFTDGSAVDSVTATFSGAALYASYAISGGSSINFRGEYFTANRFSGILSETEDANVLAFTLSGNVAAGPITFIPEFRLDQASTDIFIDGKGNGTSTAMQALLAAVFTF